MFRLTKERQRRGWSKAELARRARLDQGAVSKIESGRLQPYAVELRRLARALGIPSDQATALLEEVTNTPPEGAPA